MYFHLTMAVKRNYLVEIKIRGANNNNRILFTDFLRFVTLLSTTRANLDEKKISRRTEILCHTRPFNIIASITLTTRQEIKAPLDSLEFFLTSICSHDFF